MRVCVYVSRTDVGVYLVFLLAWSGTRSQSGVATRVRVGRGVQADFVQKVRLNTFLLDIGECGVEADAHDHFVDCSIAPN